MAATDSPRAHLRLEEFSDRELLLALDDVCRAQDGWASSREIAAHLGIGGDEPHRPISQRLSWQQRYGSVEREHLRDETGNLRYHKGGQPMHTQNWRLSEIGQALAYGRLTKGAETALGRLADGDMLDLTRWLGRRTMANGANRVAAKLVEREWRYVLAQRRAP